MSRRGRHGRHPHPHAAVRPRARAAIGRARPPAPRRAGACRGADGRAPGATDPAPVDRRPPIDPIAGAPARSAPSDPPAAVRRRRRSPPAPVPRRPVAGAARRVAARAPRPRSTSPVEPAPTRPGGQAGRARVGRAPATHGPPAPRRSCGGSSRAGRGSRCTSCAAASASPATTTTSRRSASASRPVHRAAGRRGPADGRSCSAAATSATSSRWTPTPDRRRRLPDAARPAGLIDRGPSRPAAAGRDRRVGAGLVARQIPASSGLRQRLEPLGALVRRSSQRGLVRSMRACGRIGLAACAAGAR